MNSESILTGGLPELNILKEKLVERDNLTDKISMEKIDNQRLIKDISIEEKIINDNVNTTIEKRRNEITSSFDKEIDNDQQELKNLNIKRNKEKEKGIAKRVEIETNNLVISNRGLKEEIKSKYKLKAIPSICNTKIFNIMYNPINIKDIIITIAILAICVVLIPFIVTYFLNIEKLYLKRVIFALISIFFIFIFLLIKIKIKDKYNEYFKETKETRLRIRENNKKIHYIVKRIKSDKDETIYNLEHYDTEIVKIEDRINQIVIRKNQALAEFELSSKPIIIKDIVEKDKERINDMKQKATEGETYINDLSSKLKELTADITSEYSAYIGSDMLEITKIDELIGLIEKKDAISVSEAIEKYKQK